MKEPFPYQRQGIDGIKTDFKDKRRVLYQLSTGGGKTVVFSFLTKEWLAENDGRVLILCHRMELIDQSIEALTEFGITCEKVDSKKKKLHHHAQVYVAMVETAFNRLEKDPLYFRGVSLVIADECHVQIFEKVFRHFSKSKILGCTATPIVQKKVKYWKCRHCKENYEEPAQCCDDEADEWSKPFAMSMLYESIVLGISIRELINMGRLVEEIEFDKSPDDLSSLKVGSDGEFTSESMDELYSTTGSCFNVLLNYQELCKGKKTMIFNSTSKSNKMLYDKFVEAGVNVRMFDSVNKADSGNRSELIEWFKNTPDAVLMNVGVFTTGFDCKEVEAIIVNRPINSLSLWIQIVGRGARCSDLIYKPHFILIDGGGNINRLGSFSDETRDWKKIFEKGIGTDRVKKEQPMDVQICDNCGCIMSKTELACPECGHVEEVKEKKKVEVTDSDEVLQPIKKIPPPDGEKIYRFTKSKGENINFSFKIMINQIFDMFKFYRVTRSNYLNTLENGVLIKKVKGMINKCYFVLLGKNDIQADNNRTIQYIVNKVLDKLKKYYE